MKILDTKTETQVIAMLARGDTYDAIRAVLESQGTTITISTISNVRRRNTEALAYMKNALMQHEVSISSKLLTKSRQLLERKLNRAFHVEEKINSLEQELKSEEIDHRTFSVLYEKALKAELSVAELVSLSKEMFNQSQIEQNKPTSITENPAQAKENLKTLLEAINTKNDTAVLQAIFPDA